ncbi:twin-arginine translocase TatA/TatE family subunit [Microbacterium sp. 4R-513]|uniref:twin-arginine translocase TatA/TatE family subunit n=1 Tax=Microbacterium sp. 4R-513 TaxID=2567934 RepID=UPI0013E1D2A4|nr:twin-arginine translocase TatA/TatE family subunit [Microbacterium sp. 4R-513]QIG39625.1 twin-arginine translocase TatA/TatE family subunit [Microbacterium sp. 4R-513]
MFANLNGWHLLILLAVILLLFGAAKLPGLARSVGQSARILRGELKTDAAPHAVAPPGGVDLRVSLPPSSAASVPPTGERGAA